MNDQVFQRSYGLVGGILIARGLAGALQEIGRLAESPAGLLSHPGFMIGAAINLIFGVAFSLGYVRRWLLLATFAVYGFTVIVFLSDLLIPVFRHLPISPVFACSHLASIILSLYVLIYIFSLLRSMKRPANKPPEAMAVERPPSNPSPAPAMPHL